ncbi:MULTISPECIES: hypothetical protein [Flavobacteriaceae]|uniref:Uncharacterized protein n=1 Tax=Nonlabens dokdonensis TaxID=328515 RepID=A0A1Z8AKE6_9FLAO|nr:MULTISPECIES: hypothetical protein [Flavobacteriaceae]MBW4971311.1 hypothetical protein [Croceibacter atlanticus]MCD9620405.1 hypothetical protein [Tenacibaculum maritimum]MCD9626672.1 hypothetical protein [Tenacibaculum maritimum]MCD9629069.1 hypothetical protein [Tenacibaculum maritimum]MCD9632482.1 hypothetical protein [Tenacibaculum maritimum]
MGKSIKDIVSSLVDDDGIKTEVTLTMTNQTLTKIIIALLASGATIVLVAHLTKNMFPNHQISLLTADIKIIKETLKNQLK